MSVSAMAPRADVVVRASSNGADEQLDAARSSIAPNTYWVAGDRVTIVTSGKDSHNALAVFDIAVAADPEAGPPPHAHTDCDECFFIKQGTLKILVGERWLVAGPGDFLRVPRGVTHTFRNIGGTPARMIVTVSPAGLDNFFRAVGVPVTKDNIAGHMPSRIDLERLAANLPRFKMELRGMPE